MIGLTGSRFVALLDASVLFSIRATNLSLEFAKAGLFQPRWTADIHDEWTRALLRKNPSSPTDLIRKRRSAMDAAFPDAIVSGYETLISGLELPDPDDRHVLAAAIAARADVIVTANLSDFPADRLAPHGIEAQSPDEFLHHQLTLAPVLGVAAAAAVRRRLHRPPQSADDFLRALAQAGLSRVALALSEVKDRI